MGPCGPGGDYMRDGKSMTHCIYCGEGFPYGSICSCIGSRVAREKSRKKESSLTSKLLKKKKK